MRRVGILVVGSPRRGLGFECLLGGWPWLVYQTQPTLSDPQPSLAVQIVACPICLSLGFVGLSPVLVITAHIGN